MVEGKMIIFIFFTNSFLDNHFFLEKVSSLLNSQIKISFPEGMSIDFDLGDYEVGKEIPHKELYFNYSGKDILGILGKNEENIYLGYNYLNLSNLPIFLNILDGYKLAEKINVELVIDESLTYDNFKKCRLGEYNFGNFDIFLNFTNGVVDQNIILSNSPKFTQFQYLKKYIQEYYKIGRKISFLGTSEHAIFLLKELYLESYLLKRILNLKNIFIDYPYSQFNVVDLISNSDLLNHLETRVKNTSLQKMSVLSRKMK